MRSIDAVLQEPENFRLQGAGQVADLVEEERAAVRELDLSRRLLGGAGEGAALVAEELALEQVLGDGAVDGHETPSRRADRP